MRMQYGDQTKAVHKKQEISHVGCFRKGIVLECIPEDLTEKKYLRFCSICYFAANAGALNKSTWPWPGLLFPESAQSLLYVLADIEVVEV